jgi:hypothetical protein
MAIENLERWRLLEEEITEWEPEFTSFKDAIAVLKNPLNRIPANTEIKNECRKALLAKFRPFVKGRIEANVKVTPADIKLMGLPEHKTTRTSIPAPTSRPQLDIVPSNKRQHTVIADDQKTGKRIKPDDAHGVKYCWEILPTAPERPDDLRHSLFSQRITHVFDFDAPDQGKTVYYAAHYENAKGDAGPWSDVVSAIIP